MRAVLYLTVGTLIGLFLPAVLLLPVLDSLVFRSLTDAFAPPKALPEVDMKELTDQVPEASSWEEIQELWGESNLEDSDSKPVDRPYWPGMSLP